MTESLTALIRTHHPELVGLDVALLGEGTDHRVFEVGGWLLRVPRHGQAGAALETEARVLRWLAPQLPLPVPAYALVASGLASYRKLTGTPATVQAQVPTLGPRLGTFLRALHGTDAGAATAHGVPPDDDPALGEWAQAARHDLAFAAAHGLLGAEPGSLIQHRLAAVPPPSPLPPRLIHGDFAAEHVLLDGSGVPCGVIDWSDMVVGDVAQDLGGLLHWGGPGLLHSALDTYGPVDTLTLERARFYALCRALADLAYGYTGGRPEYVQAGQRALTELIPEA